MEQEHAISKQLIQLENQFSHDSKKQKEFSSEREVIGDEEIQEIVETPQPPLRRSLTERNPPKRYIDFVLSILFTDDGEPLVFRNPLIVLAMLSGRRQ